MSGFNIRYAEQQDMSYIIGLISEAGWNPGLHDAECFFKTDPKGFLIARLDKQNIGCVSAVRYQSNQASPDFGFIGCYIMQSPWRGKIYGAWLGMHAKQRLQDCNIGIDGVVEQQTHYQHFGFKMAHRNLRYMGDCRDWKSDDSGLEIVDAKQLPFEDLLAFDHLHFPALRPTFLKAWLEPDTHHTLAVLKNEKIIAYGTVRACIRGYKIGPLFAQDINSARAIMLRLAQWVRDSAPATEQQDYYEIMMDISEENQAALALVKELNMQFVFETARMYSQTKPKLNWQQVFAISSFELG